MEDGRTLIFKVADQPWEFEQIYRLNYKTFVEEIPQHSPNPQKALIDRWLAKSTCFICLRGDHLIGMVAVCGERPFSLDKKLAHLDSYIPLGSRPCEIRLLAVERAYRGSLVFGGLLRCLIRYCRDAGYDLGLVSAAARQEKLYRHLGFVPFGPPLGTDQAPYQGMFLTWDRLTETGRLLVGEGRER
jgi:GNAT superfamily N-acetyltransferase